MLLLLFKKYTQFFDKIKKKIVVFRICLSYLFSFFFKSFGEIAGLSTKNDSGKMASYFIFLLNNFLLSTFYK